MGEKETQKFTRVGKSYLLLVLAVALLLPLVVDLVVTTAVGGGGITVYAAMYVMFAFFVWICLLMAIAWGGFFQDIYEENESICGQPAVPV